MSDPESLFAGLRWRLWNQWWRLLDWTLPRKWHRKLWWKRHPETKP